MAMEDSGSVLQQATAKIPLVRGVDGAILTQPFLDVCRLVLPVVDKLGTAFSLVRSDISGNIERLATRAAQDPERFSHVTQIVTDELAAGTAAGSSSCTKGLLWLKRAMEFTLAIVQGICSQPDASLAQVVSETYTRTLMQFHGFMASSAFTLAFKFVPTREYFVENACGASASPDQASEQMTAFFTAFSPVLADIHAFLAGLNLDDPTKISLHQTLTADFMDLGNIESRREEFSRTKEQESLIEAGANVTLNCSFPDGTTASISVPAGATVAYAKLLIEQQYGYASTKQVITLAGKPLLDPFSLCDYPGLQAGASASVAVEVKAQY